MNKVDEGITETKNTSKKYILYLMNGCVIPNLGEKHTKIVNK